MVPSMRPQVVFVLGGPGAGKGTQCSKVIQHGGYTHLSAGELLRTERRRTDSQSGRRIDRCFRHGRFAPAEITVSLLRKAIDDAIKADERNSRFLIDGFPPDEENLRGWERTMGDRADVKCVLFFDCSAEVCIERCLRRALTSGRDDDNKESLDRRIRTYLESTLPVIERYRRRGMVHTVDASRPVDQVFSHVKQILEGETWSF